MVKKIQILALVLAAGTRAWAQAPRSTPTPNDAFEWTVGGQAAGFGMSWSTERRANIIEEGNRRRFAPAQPNDQTVQLGRLVPNHVQEWLKSALDGESPARDIDLLELGPDKHTVARATRHAGSRIMEITFPAVSMGDQCLGDD